MTHRRATRGETAARLFAIAALLAGLISVVPARPVHAATYNLLIADNMNRRLIITDFNGDVLWTFNNPTGGTSRYDGPLGVEWLPNNQILATFGTGQVGIIDAATKTWVWETSGYNGDWFQSPYAANLLPDGNIAVALRYNSGGECVVYNRTTGAVVWQYLLSNAHIVRYEPSSVAYNSPDHPAILCGGWGQTAEVTYAPGTSANQTVTWSIPTEYTHDALHVENGYMLTSEGYYIQKIDRSDNLIWKISTPDEERRIAVNPYGGYIYTVLLGDRVEFRGTDGHLISQFSKLSDGTTLYYPYGIAVIDWTPPSSPSPTPTPSPSPTPSPTPSPSPSPSPSPTPTPTPTPTPSPTPSPTATPTPTPGSTTLFSDGFESGNFGAWSAVHTANGGVATVESSVVASGSYAAGLSETSTSGSEAYVRRTLSSGQTQQTASADFDVTAEGASGSNVPLLRLFDSSGNRVVSLYRQNATGGQVWVAYGGTYNKTSAVLPLGTWAHVSLRVVVNGGTSTVVVSLNGTTVFSTTSANLGTSPLSTVQIGNEIPAQAFSQYVDNVAVTTP